MNRLVILFPGFFLIFGIVGFFGVEGSGAKPLLSSTPSDPQILVEDNAVIVSFSVESAWYRNDLESFIQSYPETVIRGSFELPYSAVLLTVPIQNELQIGVLEIEKVPVDQPPTIRLEKMDATSVGELDRHESHELDIFPDAYSYEYLGIVRGIPIGRLVYYPILNEGDDWFLVRNLRLKISFPDTYLRKPSSELDIVHQAVLNNLVNPEHLDFTMVHPHTNSSLHIPAVDGVILEVNTPGVYEITSEQLMAIGYSTVGKSPKMFELARDGVPIALEWVGDSNDLWEGGEHFLFFAPLNFDRWSVSDGYTFSYQESEGARISQRNGAISGFNMGVRQIIQDYEENLLYTPSCYCAPIPAGRDGDRWVWRELSYNKVLPGDESKTLIEFNLEGYRSGTAAQITLWFIGKTRIPNSVSVDHMVDVAINGNKIGAVGWDGKTTQNVTLIIPPDFLINGTNQLLLSLPALPEREIDGVWLDAFSVEFTGTDERVFSPYRFRGDANPSWYQVQIDQVGQVNVYDITNPDDPVKMVGLEKGGQTISFSDGNVIGGRTYYLFDQDDILIPARLRQIQPVYDQQSVDVDYLMISPEAFIPALAPLVVLRESSGLLVEIVKVEAIYDNYSDGRVSPEAIRKFLADEYYAHQPLYVLLVGDGTNDPKDNLGVGFQSFIPPFLADVDPWAGETAADNRYVSVDGTDTLPDMLLGRLSADSQETVETIVEKIISYERDAPPGSWMNRMAVVGDNPDGAGNFHELAESIVRDWMPPNYLGYTLLYQAGLSDDQKTNFNHQVQESFEFGSGIILYLGHSSTDQWAQERFFHIEDAKALQNYARLPVVLQLTCFTGAFQTPGPPTLDEVLIRSSTGGAVAVWGATGLGVATGHEYLAQGFLLDDDFAQTLGSKTLQGRLRVAENLAINDLIDTFTLFGDPAMHLRTGLDLDHRIFLPTTRK